MQIEVADYGVSNGRARSILSMSMTTRSAETECTFQKCKIHTKSFDLCWMDFILGQVKKLQFADWIDKFAPADPRHISST